MVMWLQWLLVLGYLGSAIGKNIKTAEICTAASASSVNLSCEKPSRIHVISIRYQIAKETCDEKLECEKLIEKSSDGLITACNGVSSCEQSITGFYLKSTCGNVTAYYAIVSFECISDIDVNVCSAVTTMSSDDDNTLYLASPNYPRNRGLHIKNSMCVCNVTGTRMTVEIFEIYFRKIEDVLANLTVVGDMETWASHPMFLAFNMVIMNDTNTLSIMFDPYGKKSQDLWIKINGTSNIRAVCNGGTPTTPVTSSTLPSVPTTTPTTEPITKVPPNNKYTSGNSTDIGSTTPDNKVMAQAGPSNTTAVVVGCIVAVLVVAAVVGLCILFRRKRMGPFQESKKRLYDARRRDKEDEAYEMPSFVLDVSDIKSANKNGSHLDPPYIDVETGNRIDLDSLETANSPYSEIHPTTSTQKGPRPPSPAYAEPISNGFRRDKLHNIPYTEIKPGKPEPTDTGPPVYSDPIVLVQINSDSANGPPSSTTYAEVQTGVNSISRPASSPYAELEFPNYREPNVSSDSPGGTGNSRESDTKQTTLPLTSERLEQLYAKVVPKKFHSTKEMREEEKRTREMAKQTGVSSTGEQPEVDPRQEDAAKSKRPISNDYQEIREITPHDGKIPTTPPVPPKLENLLDEETENTTDKTSQKKSKGSKKGKAFKILSKRKKHKDVEKSPRRENIDGSLVKGMKERHDERAEASVNNGKIGRVTVDDNQTEDIVMVDNVLYEGGPLRHQSKPENINHPTPDSLKYPEHAPESDVLPRPQSNQYETIKDGDVVPDVPLAISGIQRIRPVPYEGITLV